MQKVMGGTADRRKRAVDGDYRQHQAEDDGAPELAECGDRLVVQLADHPGDGLLPTAGSLQSVESLGDSDQVGRLVDEPSIHALRDRCRIGLGQPRDFSREHSLDVRTRRCGVSIRPTPSLGRTSAEESAARSPIRARGERYPNGRAVVCRDAARRSCLRHPASAPNISTRTSRKPIWDI